MQNIISVVMLSTKLVLIIYQLSLKLLGYKDKLMYMIFLFFFKEICRLAV